MFVVIASKNGSPRPARDGADLRTAYITLSATGRFVAARWPNSGLALNH